MTVKKKIITILLSAVGVCAVGTGIVYGVKSTQKSEVMVIPVSDINNGAYWGNTSNTEGMVTSDASQNVYLTDSQTVQEVLVKAGDTVKEGDVLLTYDMTLMNLNLEMEKLSRDQADLRLQVAKNELKKLKKTKPVSTQPPKDDPGIDEPLEPEEPLPPMEPEDPEPVDPQPTPNPGDGDDPVDPAQIKLYRVLDSAVMEDGKITGAYKGEGTPNKPYYFLCEPDAVIRGSFKNVMMGYQYKEDGTLSEKISAGYCYVLEVREGNTLEGTLLKSWGEDASKITSPAFYEETWNAVLDLKEKKPVIPILYDGINHKLDYTAGMVKGNKRLGAYKGDGTKESPYCYLCKDQTAIQASFLNLMMGYSYDEKGNRGGQERQPVWFSLQIFDHDNITDTLRKEWVIDAGKFEQPFEESWVSKVDLAADDLFGEISGVHKAGTAGNSLWTVENLKMRDGGAAVFTKATVPKKTDGNKIQDSASGSSDPSSDEMSYTKEELAKAIKEKEAEIKELELNLKQQDIKLRATQKAVDDGQVTAKINGVIKSVGDPKNPPKDGSPFMVVSGSEGMYVTGAISELKLDSIKEGSTVSIMSYQSGIMCEAVIKEVSPYPLENYNDYQNANASGYPFTAYIASGGEQLKNNEYVQITLSQQPTEEQMMQSSDAISISKAFIREEDGVKYVYLRDEDGLLKRQEIQTGRIIYGDTYEIKSGISAEDWIAFPYGKGVKEGAKTKEGTMNQLYGY